MTEAELLAKLAEHVSELAFYPAVPPDCALPIQPRVTVWRRGPGLWAVENLGQQVGPRSMQLADAVTAARAEVAAVEADMALYTHQLAAEAAS